MAFGLSAAAIGGIAGLGGAAISAYGANKAAKQQNEAIKEAAKPDPRVDSMLWGGSNGSGPQQGLMNRFQGFLDQPQSEAMKAFGDASGQYLQQNGVGDMNAMRNASLGLMSGVSAPQAPAAQGFAAQAAPTALSAGGPQVQAHSQGPVLWNKGETFSAPQAMQAAQMQSASVQAPQAMQAAMASGAQVNAPRQNGIDLSGSYDSLINGPAGANPFLTGAIGKGINQSANAFGAMQRDSTQNLLENIMPSIRGGAIIAGGMGGSRQGIAEGRALDSFAKEQQRAMSQFGQNNTDAAVAAQAGAYDADRNRQLAATQGLGAQQYGVASQNASMAQQTAMANQAAANNANQTNYQGLLSGAMTNASNQQQANATNAGLQQQAASTNYAGQLQTNQQNASNLQQANLANQAVGNNAAQFGAQQAQAASQANAQLGQQNSQFNAGLLNQGNQFNAGLQQQMGLANLGNVQQTSLANMQSQLGTNQLNTNRTQSGMAGLSGLLGTAYQNAGNQDNYALNRAQQVNSLLYPYLGKTQAPQPSPVYSNSTGAGLGGALMGMQIGQGLAGMFNSGSNSSTINAAPAAANYNYQPTQLSTNPSALQGIAFLPPRGV